MSNRYFANIVVLDNYRIIPIVTCGDTCKNVYSKNDIKILMSIEKELSSDIVKEWNFNNGGFMNYEVDMSDFDDSTCEYFANKIMDVYKQNKDNGILLMKSVAATFPSWAKKLSNKLMFGSFTA